MILVVIVCKGLVVIVSGHLMVTVDSCMAVIEKGGCGGNDIQGCGCDCTF